MKKDNLPVFNITTRIFLLLFMGLSLNACSPDKSAEYAGPIEDLRIGVGMYSSDFYGLLFLAEIEGFFRERGLDITLVRMPSGANAIRALEQGNVDMGMGTEFPFVREIIQGRNLKVITTVWRGDVLYLVGRRDRGIREPSDFRGKKIAFTVGTQLEFFLGRYLLYHGITLEDIVTVDTDLLSLLDPVLSGEADGVVCAEPDLAMARKELGRDIVTWAIQEEQPTYGLIACRSEFVKFHPDIIKRFLQALRRAELCYQDDPRKARAQILGHPARKDSFYKDDLPLLSYGLFLEKPFLVMLEDEARWCIERGESYTRDVPNFLESIYFDGLESVKPEGISIIR
jgi:ABC-type nitrate/sulfonate/bicarbonate transport system substrate-binding protein